MSFKRDKRGYFPRQADSTPPGSRWVSERALRLASGEATLAWYAALVARRFAEIEDLIPADGSLLLVLRPGTRPSRALLAALAAAPEPVATQARKSHELVVEYGGDAGPDLPALAALAGLGVDDYVSAHAAAEYTVAFLGFQPGFPYLTGLPRILQAPRRASPRARVPARSVAVGGAYTGIYPADGPGGWQIVGRVAAARLFDVAREAPALLAPGDRVRFVPA